MIPEQLRKEVELENGGDYMMHFTREDMEYMRQFAEKIILM